MLIQKIAINYNDIDIDLFSEYYKEKFIRRIYNKQYNEGLESHIEKINKTVLTNIRYILSGLLNVSVFDIFRDIRQISNRKSYYLDINNRLVTNITASVDINKLGINNFNIINTSNLDTLSNRDINNYLSINNDLINTNNIFLNNTNPTLLTKTKQGKQGIVVEEKFLNNKRYLTKISKIISLSILNYFNQTD